ncbi:DUF4272 domain-containing protein [Massilia sp. Dwa41.01b]|uniref:DUF4272 domain-containing protein n=1 Tax=unclassified Massilia TaxID=2609279 RepID=UPI001602AA63|nr:MULTISPECIES: DUF4272 domain-containing protein [unclassified Massilia]QNA90551.1 DUF4272 domain-containing protein [Massilia sp. Dwa41.01b]QNA97782.1 DUF4272 domain-containing protein [Massilia sp. Se16.2.3]
MATEPVTLFAQAGHPDAVIDVLRQMDARFKVAGPAEAWAELTVTTSGWLRKKQLRITHDPAYYTGEGWQVQLNGMRGYFARFPAAPEQAKALGLIGQFGFVLGTICDPDMEAGDERLAILSAIAEALDAVWFTPSALRDARGRVLYGANVNEFDPGARWPAYTPGTPVPAAGPVDERALALKQRVFGELASLGFKPANALPLPDLDLRVRDAQAIVMRLMALQAVFAWAAAPEHAVGSEVLRGYIARNGLRAAMTESELALIDLPRTEAQSRHGATVGWKLENLWALAWVAGFPRVPTLDAGQVPDEVINELLFDFLPPWEGSAADFAANASMRPASEVIPMEYRFYCAHNAVRSAQMGGATVPSGFDPIAHGGAVHERRHALTWALAGEDSWDETDLST